LSRTSGTGRSSPQIRTACKAGPTKAFVEGESDKVILKRYAAIFHPQHAGDVDFETKLAEAGHGYVIDMLNGWRPYYKHHTQVAKAAGILDWDAAASSNEWNETLGTQRRRMLLLSETVTCYRCNPGGLSTSWTQLQERQI